MKNYLHFSRVRLISWRSPDEAANSVPKIWPILSPPPRIKKKSKYWFYNNFPNLILFHLKQDWYSISKWKIEFEFSCLIHLTCSSKNVWSHSKLFDHIQYFLDVVKYFWSFSNMKIYKEKSHFSIWSKKVDCIQKFITMVKIFWM